MSSLHRRLRLVRSTSDRSWRLTAVANAESRCVLVVRRFSVTVAISSGSLLMSSSSS
ncbi:hypothetical protein ACFFQW_22100 [Umezawaea endophytica]|uniref:Uncharacterized protein n=1 Tax=Umezawaea endophytica TaxID=1654476 RepID=A0A9X2VIP9_9PSEU|nr:hypothetical protein [Umezawaea endophytica]MCS7477440.1 hypothetical protein [Umezawaea endophytica]